MKKFNLNIEEEIGIMSKYQLTPNELFVIRYILTCQEGYKENFLLRFMAIPCCQAIMHETVVSLQNKDIILKSYKIPAKGQSFDPCCVPFNQMFLKFLDKSCNEMFTELYNAYPQFAIIGGGQVQINVFSKKFDSFEDAGHYYGKLIHWNAEKHKYIMELVEWAKENTNFINFTLASFLIDQRWLAIESLKNGDNSNINYNSFRSI